MSEQILTVKEFADKYKLHYESVRRMLRQKKIPGAIKIGGAWRIVEVKK